LKNVRDILVVFENCAVLVFFLAASSVGGNKPMLILKNTMIEKTLT
jgi:hypothetical protein